MNTRLLEGAEQRSRFQSLGSRPDFEVAAEWQTPRLWAVASLRSERNRPDLDLLSVFLGRGVIPYGEGGGQVHKPSLDLSSYQVVQPGDLVLNNQQAWRGSVGVSRLCGIVSPAYVVLQLNDALEASYASHLFQSPLLTSQFVTASKGVGDIQRDIHMPWLKNVRVPIPDRTEQVAIARYLGHVETHIQRYARAKRDLVALLNEQAQAIAERILLRGQGEKTPMRRPEFEPRVEVPVHWTVLRLKDVLRPVDVRSKTGQEVLLSLRRDHGVVVYAEHFSRPAQVATTHGYKVVEPGQLVMNRLQANNGLIFVSHYRGAISPDYSVFEARASQVRLAYVEQLLRTPTYRTHFRRIAKGLGTGTSGFLRVYDDDFLATHVALPPAEEQANLVAALNEETVQLRRCISETEKELAVIGELRTRIKMNVLSGRMDVRRLAADLPDETPDVGDALDDEAEPFEDLDLEGEEAVL